VRRKVGGAEGGLVAAGRSLIAQQALELFRLSQFGRPMLGRAESRNGLHQFVSLMLQVLGCGGRLLNQRSVLLRHLIEFSYR
jgi:hypothetical protein